MVLENIYTYQTSNGIVIPDTSNVKTSVTSAIKTIFGNDLDTSDETPIGRLIEAITLTIADMIKVNAQNVNNFNPTISVGAFLDNLGALFGVNRLTDESDDSYRTRIMDSQSRTSGYVQSIRQALSAVSGVTSVCVLENGHNYPVMLPNAASGISVDPHSVFICVGGWTSGSTEAEVTLRQNIAKAILASKSAGCGYVESTEYGTPAEETVTDSNTGSQNTVVFYAPSSVGTIIINTSVRGESYTGTDIVADTKSIISALFAGTVPGNTITSTEIASAISASGLGIICTSITMTVDTVEKTSITILPYQSATVSSANINVTVV